MVLYMLLVNLELAFPFQYALLDLATGFYKVAVKVLISAYV